MNRILRFIRDNKLVLAQYVYWVGYFYNNHERIKKEQYKI